MFKDYYNILGLTQNASQDDIRRAYRIASKKWHPDMNPNIDTTNIMQDINEAYFILSDTTRRARYDKEFILYKRYLVVITGDDNEHSSKKNQYYNIQDNQVKQDVEEARANVSTKYQKTNTQRNTSNTHKMWPYFVCFLAAILLFSTLIVWKSMMNKDSLIINQDKTINENVVMTDTSRDEQQSRELSSIIPDGYVDLGLSVYWKNKNEWNNEDSAGFYDYTTAKKKFNKHLPTKAQLDELAEKCTWVWTGSGCQVEGPNGNSIFMPASGFRDVDGNVLGKGIYGLYWSSTPHGSDFAWYLNLHSSYICTDNYSRRFGHSVRLVREK